MKQAEFLAKIHQHQGLLHKICRIYGRTGEDRKDLMQEMIFQLWKALPGFDERFRFSTWMYRVALNTAISSFRKAQRSPLFASLEHAVQSPSSSPPNDDHDQLYQAINHLSLVNKALTLLHLEGHSHQEIGEILEISPNLVGVRLHRIRKQLKQFLTKYEYEF